MDLWGCLIFIVIITVIIIVVLCVIRKARATSEESIVTGGKVHDPARLKRKVIKAFEEFCYPKSYKLQPQQNFAGRFFNDPDHLPCSALMFHKIGSGKTCTSIQIGRAIRNAISTRSSRPIYLMPASLIPGFYAEMKSPCGKLVPAGRGLSPRKTGYTTNQDIDKDFQIYSYNKFTDLMAGVSHINQTDSLNAPAIIVDEVQNINNPSGAYYNAILTWIQAHPKATVILLSATPLFDNAHELYGLVRLMYGCQIKDLETKLTTATGSLGSLDDSATPNKLDTGLFGQLTTLKSGSTKQIVDIIPKLFGKPDRVPTALTKAPKSQQRPVFISFYAGAPDYTFPEARVRILKCYMSEFQARWYRSEVAAEITSRGNIRTEAAPNNFYIKSRQRSNVVYPKGVEGADVVGDDGNETATVTALLTPQIIRTNLATYSCKWDKLVRKLRKGRLSFIYSGFTGPSGIAGIVHVLEALGWKNFAKHGPGRRRFAIWSGDESGTQKDRIRASFNDEANDNASQIQVVIGSPAIKEGVSLYRVRQVHVMEAYWNHSRLEQIYGRAVRYCSHKRLPPEDRDVDIYIYAALTTSSLRAGAVVSKPPPGTRANAVASKPSPNTSIDLYMLQMADKKRDEVEPVIEALKNVAVKHA